MSSAQFKPGVNAGVNIANVKPAYILVYNGQTKNINGNSITSYNVGVNPYLRRYAAQVFAVGYLCLVIVFVINLKIRHKNIS